MRVNFGEQADLFEDFLLLEDIFYKGDTMPSIKRTITAAVDDALLGLKFKTQAVPALVSLYASSSAAGESLSFSVGSQEFLNNGEINLEAADRVIDTDRDALLLQEPVPPGEYFINVPTVAGDMTFLLIIEPVI